MSADFLNPSSGSFVSSGAFLDSIEDVFSALLVAGAELRVRDGALTILAKPGSIPRDVGRAAHAARLALAEHATIACERCGGDQAVVHTFGCVTTHCAPCTLTIARRRDPSRRMDHGRDYLERAACKTCPRVGETFFGWCAWCLAKREGVNWDEYVAAASGGSDDRVPAVELVDVAPVAVSIPAVVLPAPVPIAPIAPAVPHVPSLPAPVQPDLFGLMS